MTMQSKIQSYFSLVQNYYDNQSKYFDSRIEINKQTKKIIDLGKQLMFFEQDKELKKIELEEMKKKGDMTSSKDKDKFSKLEVSIKDLREKISKKKLEISRDTQEREKTNANSHFFKKKLNELLEEINANKPDPSFPHPINYLLLK